MTGRIKLTDSQKQIAQKYNPNVEAQTVSRPNWSDTYQKQQEQKSVAAYEKRQSELAEQRRQAQVDLDIDTINRIDAELKTLRANAGKTTVGDRLGDMSGVVAADLLGSFANSAGTIINLFQDPEKNKRDIARLQTVLNTGYTSDGKPLTDAQRIVIQNSIAEKQNQIATWEKPESKVNKLYDFAATTRSDADKFTEQAKSGLNAIGQAAVDLGIGAGKLGAITAASYLAPISGIGNAITAINVFGNTAQDAREAGAPIERQALAGAGKAGVAVLAGKLFNQSGPLKTAYGKGFFDNAVSALAKKPGGQLIMSYLTEFGEEFLEALAGPAIERMTYNKDAKYDAEWFANSLYESAIAGILGAGTKGIDIIADTASRNSAKQGPATVPVTSEDSNAPKIKTPQNGSKSDSGAYTQEAYQRDANAVKAAEEALAKAKADGADAMQIAFLQANVDSARSKLGFVNTNNASVGAAETGFTTPDSKSEVKTSRLADTTMGYNAVEGEATGMDAEQYAQLLKYKTLTEKMATQQADDMLYVEQDGQRKFIRDVDEQAYQDVANWLNMAPAWDASMTDAAHMIRNELKGRAVNGDITQEEYVAWLETMREHATAGGQGIQAHAKWSRTDNRGGAATELEAKRALEKSKLPPEEQARIFSQIVQWDAQVEAVKPGDTASLKEIIMKAANERGVVNGLFGKFFAKRAESALDALTFDQLKEFAYSSTAALANDSTPADAGRKVKTIQILNMLSKPTTFSKNITGNTTFYGLDALAMNGASLIDMAVAKLTGTRSVAAEGLPDMRAAAKALQMAIAEITLDVDMGGETTRYGTGSNRTFKMGGTGVFNTNTAVDKFTERVLSSLERNQAYLLTATDEFYKGATRATEANTQKLIDEGKIKTDDKEYAKKQADNLAKVRTFQDNSKVSAAIQDIHDVLNLLVGFGDSGKVIKGRKVHSFGLGDIVAPFTKVAGNLVSRGMEYSPLNAAKGAVEIVKQVAAAGQGNVDAAKQAQGVSDLARGMTGTAIAYGFMQLVKAGLMRQAEDEGDKDVAALNQSEGIRGTQINISAAERDLNGESSEWQYGDTLVDLSSIEPLNLLMNLGAEMAKEPENPLLSSFGSTLTSIGKAAAELPVLENVGSFVKDVAVYKKDWKEALGEMAANTAISSVVPNAISGIAAGLDDRPRNVYTGDDLWDYIQDSFKSRIPGLRETLPGSTNSFGEEKTYQGSQDSLLASMLSPVGINTYTQSNVSEEMERVREATGGDVSFYPESTIPKELSYDNKETVLTYDQRQKYQNVRGTTQTNVTDAMMKTRDYKNTSAKQQAILLNRCKDYAQQTAKASILGEKSVEKWVLNAKNAQKDLGVSTAEYLALYEKYGSDYLTGKAYEKTKKATDLGLSVGDYISLKKDADADGNGRVDAVEAKSALKNNSKRADLWDIINTTGADNPYK